jgi:hypothetical protein
MKNTDEIFIHSMAAGIKFFLIFIALKGLTKLRIDPMFWIVFNMLQVLRLITLLDLDVGIILRDF